MNSKNKLVASLSGAVIISSLMVGCQDYEAGYTLSEVKQSAVEREYAANFLAEYGDLSEVQSWDLSSLGDELNYMGGAQTRANSGEFCDTLPDGSTYSFHPLVGDTLGNTSDIAKTSTIYTNLFSTQTDANYYYLPEATFDWLTINMTEDTDHTEASRRTKKDLIGYKPIPGAGNNTKFQKPQGDFWLLPVYQGFAVSCYDLHLVVNGTDYLVWTKGQGLEYQKKKYQYVGYYKYTDKDGNEKEAKNTINSEVKTVYENPIKVGDNYTKQYTILSDDNPTDQGDGTWKHTVTFTIGKDTAQKEIINTSSTSLKGQKVDISYPYYKVDDPKFKSSEWVNLADYTENKDFCTLEEYPYCAWEVRCKPIHFDASKFKGDFFFYLEITKSQWDTNADRNKSNAALPGTKQRSDKGMMAAMAASVQPDIAAVTGSSQGINAIMLGCEAANRGSSDYDYNDVVFLLVSNATQPFFEIEERRYLCEDLGSTYDFDFNDIVVDVKQSQEVTSEYTETNPTTHEGTWTRTLGPKIQTVSIAHMCGTIPFQLYVGNSDKEKAGFCFEAMSNPNIVDGKTTGYTPNPYATADVAKYCISKEIDTTTDKWWDPATNKVFIDVWPYSGDKENVSEGGSSTVMHTVQFPDDDPGKRGSEEYAPKGGKIPQMIAVDPTVNWMLEHEHIPTAWVKAASTIDDIKNEPKSDTTSETGN